MLLRIVNLLHAKRERSDQLQGRSSRVRLRKRRGCTGRFIQRPLMMLVQSHQSNALFVEQATTLWIATRRLLESSRACQEPGWGDLREKNQRGLYAHRISNESRQTGHGLGHADGDDLLSANASGETARGSSKKGMPSRLRRKTVVCQRDDRCDSDVEWKLQILSSIVHLGAAPGETAGDVDA